MNTHAHAYSSDCIFNWINHLQHIFFQWKMYGALKILFKIWTFYEFSLLLCSTGCVFCIALFYSLVNKTHTKKEEENDEEKITWTKGKENEKYFTRNTTHTHTRLFESAFFVVVSLVLCVATVAIAIALHTQIWDRRLPKFIFLRIVNVYASNFGYFLKKKNDLKI